MDRSQNTGTHGFSLLEIGIVVVTLAMLAAIGIPPRSQGSRGPLDSPLGGDLAALRNAIDLYSAEHGGAFPSAADIVAQLTTYTDIAGHASRTKTTPHIYGPYIPRIPMLSVGDKRGKWQIAATDGDNVAWLYTESSGTITANTDAATDNTGTLYSSY